MRKGAAPAPFSKTMLPVDRERQDYFLAAPFLVLAAFLSSFFMPFS